MMRWLARRFLREDLLDLESGVTLYYEQDFTGPGYILQDHDERRLIGHYALLGWLIIAFFLVPEDLLTSWLTGYAGTFFGDEYVAIGLLWVLLLLGIHFVVRSLERFLETLDRRDPSQWEEDLKQLAAASEAEKGFGPLGCIVAVISGGWVIGFLVEILLFLIFGV